jgi:hypothetical protein
MSRATKKPITRPTGKSRSISDLYRDFEAAYADMQAVPAIVSADKRSSRHRKQG